MHSDLGQRTRTVADDLSAIFPVMPPSASEPSVVATHVFATPSAPRRRVWPTLGLILATGLVGVAAGALIVPPLLDGHSGRLEPLAAPRPVAIAVASPAPRPAAMMQALPKAAEPLPVPPSRTATTEPIRRQAPAVPSTMVRCAQVDLGDRAACAHGVMMAQDRGLRRAYARAVRAGVSRDSLADTTRRWARLRRQAISHPAAAAAGYASLSRELSRRTPARPPGRDRAR